VSAPAKLAFGAPLYLYVESGRPELGMTELRGVDDGLLARPPKSRPSTRQPPQRAPERPCQARTSPFQGHRYRNHQTF
jgi:hypothetical protein